MIWELLQRHVRVPYVLFEILGGCLVKRITVIKF